MVEDFGLYHSRKYPNTTTMLYSDRNTNALGKKRDACEGKMLKEAVAIGLKMYLVLEENQKNIRKAKGGKKGCDGDNVEHKHYKESLFAKIKIVSRNEHS